MKPLYAALAILSLTLVSADALGQRTISFAPYGLPSSGTIALVMSKGVPGQGTFAEVDAALGGALRRAVIDGDVETGSVMAGQSVGMVTREQPTAEIIAELVGEAETALERRA